MSPSSSFGSLERLRDWSGPLLWRSNAITARPREFAKNSP